MRCTPPVRGYFRKQSSKSACGMRSLRNRAPPRATIAYLCGMWNLPRSSGGPSVIFARFIVFPNGDLRNPSCRFVRVQSKSRFMMRRIQVAEWGTRQGQAEASGAILRVALCALYSAQVFPCRILPPPRGPEGCLGGGGSGSLGRAYWRLPRNAEGAEPRASVPLSSDVRNAKLCTHARARVRAPLSETCGACRCLRILRLTERS